MTAAIQRLEDGTIKFTITIPAALVAKTYDEVVEENVKHAEIKGFRKGKAPRKLVEENLDSAKVREEMLKVLLPKAYVDAVNQHNVRPIMQPKIHVHPEKIAFTPNEKDNKDWEFEALTCEAPSISLGKYKDAVQKVTAKSKIIIPGKDPFDAAQGKKSEVSLDEVIKALLGIVDAKVPNILVEQEAERLLAQTLDEIKKLGLTLDQYLSSTKRTAEDLRKEYEQKAKNDLTLEFVLQKIAEEEKITVEEKEINEAIQKAKDENERKHLESNRYLLAAILRQQKTLDFLKNL